MFFCFLTKWRTAKRIIWLGSCYRRWKSRQKWGYGSLRCVNGIMGWKRHKRRELQQELRVSWWGCGRINGRGAKWGHQRALREWRRYKAQWQDVYTGRYWASWRRDPRSDFNAALNLPEGPDVLYLNGPSLIRFISSFKDFHNFQHECWFNWSWCHSYQTR